MLRLPLLLALLPGCLRPVPLGPETGECAVVPDAGAFSWGEIGIGNCLAGPVDARFFERDGTTWLAVSNADPYRNFETGSLLVIDWSSLDLAVGKNLLPALDGSSDTPVIAYSLPLEAFSGEIGILPDRELAIVPSRLSEESDSRVALDHAQIVDLSGVVPEPWSVDDTVQLRDDPQPVVVDLEAELAFVGNLTDHSVSVVDWSADRVAVEGDVVAAGEPCDGACALALVDVAPVAALDGGFFRDTGADGFAEIANLVIEDIDLLVDDVWTLSWVDGSFRTWVEEDVLDGFDDPTGAHALQRWTSGQTDGGYVASALGVELGPFLDVATVEDPYFVLEAGIPTLWFADAGRIRRATNAGAASDWAVVEGEIALDPVPAAPFLGAPSVVRITEILTLFYDQRAAAGADAAIGMTVSDDGLTFQLDDPTPVLDPADFDGYASFEHPYVLVDPVANRYRMWLSARDDAGRWSILLSESDDGLAWGAPEEVLAAPGADRAAPTVQYVNGRYVVWFASGDGAAWSVASAWSYDGRTWSDPVSLFTPALAYDPLDPPRPAVESDLTAGWSIEGRDLGIQPIIGFTGAHIGIAGLGFEIVGGHQFSNEVLGRTGAALGLVPGAVLDDRMYVTGIQRNGRSRIAILEPTLAGTWLPVVEDAIPVGTGGNLTGAGSPAVLRDGDTWHLYYAAYDTDGAAAMRHATSPDGLAWTPEGGALSPSTDDWDSIAQLPHAVEVLADGGVRVWFGGSDGELWRIGSIVADDPDGPWRRETGEFDPWVFGPGAPGSFDDSGVKDPYVVTIDGLTHLYYAGFDGGVWHLGHAVDDGSGELVRRLDAEGTASVPAMSGQGSTFSAVGVESPVAVLDGDAIDLWYAGFDGFELRAGLATASLDDPEVVYPTARFPTPGDALEFESQRGDKAVSAIRLDQITAEFSTDGVGMSGMILDEERGFLYVTSKLAGFLYVVDIRDDSTLGWEDSNYLDLEGVVRIPSETGTLGLRGGVLSPARDRLYLDARSPDQILVLDLGVMLDDELKEVVELAPIGSLPVRTLAVNEGPPTFSLVGANNGALSADERWLVVPEFRSNLLDIYDLDMGAMGTLVNEIPYVGENPHVVRLSPDGRHAVVVNYTGDVIDGASSSTLAILDLDPASPTFQEVVTWIANR